MKKIRLYLRYRLLFALFLASILSLCAHAQSGDIKIKGTVKDTKGLPLPGVSIKIKGTKAGGQTPLKAISL
jgi:hypothetical protein